MFIIVGIIQGGHILVDMGVKRKQKQIKSSKIGKDITHYLHKQSMKGGKDEVEQKLRLQIELDKLKEEGSAKWEDTEYIENMRKNIQTK